MTSSGVWPRYGRCMTLADLRPMLADDRKHRPYSDTEWVFEIKVDGYRMLAEFGAGDVHLRTRQAIDCTTWFPEICRALRAYEGGPYIATARTCPDSGATSGES